MFRGKCIYSQNRAMKRNIVQSLAMKTFFAHLGILFIFLIRKSINLTLIHYLNYL